MKDGVGKNQKVILIKKDEPAEIRVRETKTELRKPHTPFFFVFRLIPISAKCKISTSDIGEVLMICDL
ncbi:hypothetical protein EHS13_21830 [Paenibacillus psychroresistens]|uniref:Uncharacterized protein n=1 Tax=Paenibacillus psychroresistens TaxID=1778678 RepID=A0A6B8RNB5_9BACL|nr:hypothetical protein EHS13_21830 [Paenibacillus psychroresistens]